MGLKSQENKGKTNHGDILKINCESLFCGWFVALEVDLLLWLHRKEVIVAYILYSIRFS